MNPGKPLTRAAVANQREWDETPIGHRSDGGTGGGERSVVASRRSRKSARSTAKASEVRLNCATKVAQAEAQLEKVVRSLQVAENELKCHREEIVDTQRDLLMYPEASEEYKKIQDRLKSLGKEDKEFQSAVDLLRLDETFARNAIEREKKLSGLANRHANDLENVESDHSQDLSDEDNEFPEFSDLGSQESEDTEYQLLNQRLHNLRGSPKPKPEKQTSDVSPSTAVQQLAQALTQALATASGSGCSNNNTNEKMLARQAMKMQLSSFEGNSAEWPVFVQQYHTVSNACGLSNVENLNRLQNSLKGEARSAVSALLMSPDNVSEILNVLEERFGNPRLVVQRLVEQAQALPTIKEGDHGGFLQLVDVVRNLATTAETMNCLAFLASPQLLTQLVKKLPASMQMKWAEHQDFIGKPFPDLSDIAAWLKMMSRSVMRLYEPSCASSSDKVTPTIKNTKQPQKSFVAAETEKNKSDRKCRACDADHHHLSRCTIFLEMEPEERWKWVRTNKYCFSCLNYGHGMVECRSKRTCGIDGCDKTHNQKLHPKERSPATAVSTASETVGHTVVSSHINLNILPVKLKGPRGIIDTFAMLDPGATITVIDANVADQLGLKGPSRPLTHSGLHEATTVSDSRTVSLSVLGRSICTSTAQLKTPEVYKLENVRTVPRLSLPRQSVRKSTLQKWSHLKKVPVDLFEQGQPTVLIGQDNAHLCNTSELVLGPSNAPAAGKTKLGWVLMGRVGAAEGQQVSYHFREETEDDLHQLVKYHFSTEAFGVKPNVEKPRSREDARAWEIMNRSLKRVGDRWECNLLWKSDSPELPVTSKDNAVRRLRSMEKKMDSSPEFAEAYREKIAAYLEKGYARKLSDVEASEVSPKTYYLPHFMAKNPKKKNKLRFVLDAKAQSEGHSLNDFLLAGPDQMKSLQAILFKFREKVIGITADVRDMFHRIGVTKEDAVAQRFLWRGMDRVKEPDIYQMDVLIFGATCSPAIAQEAKNKNAKLFETTYPDAAVAVVQNFFVDDYLDSKDSVSKAIQQFKETREIMSHGNFDLVGWLSNSKEFMEAVPEELRASTSTAVQFGDEGAVERVLGLFWKPVEDVFTFSLSFLRTQEDVMSGKRMPTKRELLALVMSLYDPLGFLSLFTIRGKMLLQDSWRTKIGWDDEVQDSGKEKWKQWRDGLMAIPEFSLPRCYSVEFSTAVSITLHVFVDASEQAYGAVAYFVVEGSFGRLVSFVSSKARVAPLKPLSIPRMELQAAVLGARHAVSIKEEHTIRINRTLYWSDSRTVLCWLKGDGRKFQSFVAHRIGEIQELTNPQEWRWVPTKLNVADEMTRDGEECDWSTSSRWVNGPEFLKQDEDCWPVEKAGATATEELELKKEFTCAALELKEVPVISVEKFSSWIRLIRVTATCLRFVDKLQKTEKVRPSWISNSKAAEIFWWKVVQRACFQEEIKCVEQDKPLPKRSRVCHLNLFLDYDGVLRLQGRLDKSEALGRNLKNPVLLDPKHHYTRILISKLHEESGHHGQERVVNELRQMFYMPQLRAAVKRSWSNCQQCKNGRAKPEPPLMGQLPAHRLEVGIHPFTNSGVDYFGPMSVTVGRRHEKRWGVLFTCLSTRAVHLEVAASLSTDSCILAIRRFLGRRGCPRRLYSDNGTNFHGANNELKKALKELDQKKINSMCESKCIEWHFNPPSAPHMGGSWERLVRSVKVALYTTLKEQAPKEEVFQTLMVEAEHSVNSHPLTHVSVDPDDPEALTPNHFLIGRSSNGAPPGSFDKDDLCSRKTWRKAQFMADVFWKRWMREYLPTLQRRTKWLTVTKPVEVGDVALEADPQQPRNSWSKGIVTEVYPGEDGVVRVVDFKTTNGTYRRPVAKLAFLDVRRDCEAAPKVTNAAVATLVSGSMSPHQVEDREVPNESQVDPENCSV